MGGWIGGYVFGFCGPMDMDMDDLDGWIRTGMDSFEWIYGWIDNDGTYLKFETFARRSFESVGRSFAVSRVANYHTLPCFETILYYSHPGSVMFKPPDQTPAWRFFIFVEWGGVGLGRSLSLSVPILQLLWHEHLCHVLPCDTHFFSIKNIKSATSSPAMPQAS